MQMRTMTETSSTWTKEHFDAMFNTVSKFWMVGPDAPSCPCCSYDARLVEWDDACAAMFTSCIRQRETLFEKFMKFVDVLEGGDIEIQSCAKDSAMLMRTCLEQFVHACFPEEIFDGDQMDVRVISDAQLVLQARKGFFTVEG